MKKISKTLIPAALLIVCILQGCATIFGGHVHANQRSKPLAGQPKRKLRTVAFIADILFLPALIVDFATCPIYSPNSSIICRYPPPVKE